MPKVPLTLAVVTSLTLSSGPVFNPQGQCVGSFNSIWRMEANGGRKIVFDKGGQDCSW